MRPIVRQIISVAVVASLCAHHPTYPAAPSVSAANAPTVTVTTVEGATHRGRLLGFDLGNELRLATRDEREKVSIPTADIVHVRPALPPPEKHGSPILLDMVNGDRIRGAIMFGDEESLHIKGRTLGGAVAVRLSRVRCLLTRAGVPVWSAYRSVAPDTLEQDRVVLLNGDVLSGLVLSVDATGARIEVQDFERRLAWTIVAGIGFADPETEDSTGLGARIHLADGSRVTVRDLRWAPGPTIELRLRGQRVTVRSAKVVDIEIVGGRWQWLTTLEPVSVTHTSMLSADWAYQIDRSVTGNPLSVGSQTFTHGIGVHSRTSLIYDLGDGYRELVTRCGMDRSAGPLASVEAVIRVDGRTLWTQTTTAESGLRGPIRIPLTGARTLELLVDFAERGGLQDRFNWIEPGLVHRSAPSP